MEPSSSDSQSLFSIHSSAVLFSLCPYLSPSDLLALRATCKQSYEMLHNEEESEVLWKILLQRDFGFECTNNDNNDWKQTLQVEQCSTAISSLFGVDPARENAIIEATSAFDSWKRWKRVSARYFQKLQTDESSNDEEGNEEGIRLKLVHGPFFLRAARFWQRIYQWCDHGPGSGIENMGERVRQSFTYPGMSYCKWPALGSLRTCVGLEACRAVFAFSGGQNREFSSADTAFCGLFGGYQAYRYYSCTQLCVLANPNTNTVIVAKDRFPMSEGKYKTFMIDGYTGALGFNTSHDGQTYRAVDISSTNNPPQTQDLLVWLEEYAHRLVTGRIGVGVMGSHPNDPKGITLYPQLPSANPISNECVVVDNSSSSMAHHQDGASPPSTVSRAVTRGVEVVGSAVYVPQGGQDLGFIYRIRIRLLTKTQEGYQSPEERGFATCQLRSRHWRIADDATGKIDRVDGEGVIGMYPLLREGGYTEDGETISGVFQYQSCAEGYMSHGSFGGHIQFIPGSLAEPTGPPFEARLEPFELSTRPKFMY